MKILAVETSCDDTCISLLETKGKKNPSFKILSNIVSSQVEIHKKWGGVYPTLAKREHQKNLPLIFKKLLKTTKNSEFDLVAVTVGSGLDPCLWIGVNFVKALAKEKKLPLVPVNHVEAHIFASFINNTYSNIFPAICLIVSGGHTQLVLMKDFGKYEILGETRDDAAGECFDKVARILGLGYPGGPVIATEALKVKEKKFKISLPRPMIYQKNYDFSFSGLKTAVLYDFKNRKPKTKKSKEYISEIAKEIQESIINVLVHKTLKASKDYKVKSIILGGGVTANQELRKRFKERIKKNLPKAKYIVPDQKYSTDNAAMIAVTAYYQYLKKKNWKEIKANANLRIDERL